MFHSCIQMVRNKGWLRAALVGAACFAGLAVVLHRSVVEYYPVQDEMSFIVNSTPLTPQFDAKEWITKGYSNYCCPYPEWSTPIYNYIRPIVNICYYLNWCMWGQSWGCYLYLHWVILAIGAALAFYVTDVLLGCSCWLAAMVAVLLAGNLGNSAGLMVPNFCTDALCGVFVGTAFIALMRRKHFWAGAMLTLALFTKEISIWCPFAAAATVVLGNSGENKQPCRRLIPSFVALFAPVVIWMAVRLLVFGSVMGGISQPPGQGFKGIALNVYGFVLNWPLGLAGSALDPSTSVRALLLRSWADVSWPAVVAGLFNVLLIVWAVAGIGRWLLHGGWRRDPPVISSMLVWVAGSMGFMLLLGLGCRHGYLFYWFALPLAAYCLARAVSARSVTSCLCIALALATAGCLHVCATRDYYLMMYDWRVGVTRSMVDAVREAANRFEAVYVVDDFGVQSSGGSLGAFVGSPVPVVVVNSAFAAAADADQGSANPGTRSIPVLDIRPQAGDDATIAVDLGDACRFSFPCTSPALMFPDADSPVAVRNPQMSYCFPQLKHEVGALSGRTAIVLGGKMVVRLHDARRYGIVYYDAETQTYKIAGKGASVHLPAAAPREG
jgi:hypothetical protein